MLRTSRYLSVCNKDLQESFQSWRICLINKDSNILVCGPLKKANIVLTYSRSSKYTKVNHCCHSANSSPSVLLQLLGDIQPRSQKKTLSAGHAQILFLRPWLINGTIYSIIDSTYISTVSRMDWNVHKLHRWASLWTTGTPGPMASHATDPSLEQVWPHLVCHFRTS